MESDYLESSLGEMEGFQHLNKVVATESSPDPDKLVEKIGKLQDMLMELVSRRPHQRSDVEKVIDQLTSHANGMLLTPPPPPPPELLIKSRFISDDVVGIHCSPDRRATALHNRNSGAASCSSHSSEGSIPESDRFTLDCLDFHVPVELQAPAATLMKSEHAQSGGNDEFMSFLVSDPDKDVLDSVNVKPEIVPDEEAHDMDVVLPPGSYDLIELDAAEILAEHTHFCELCGKGFKRDANLRMHMRGHGDEYKSASALSKPKEDQAQDKPIESQQPQVVRVKRYSCPYEGCKRHKLHPKFTPLKTVLCVKNHYRRSHCPKMLSCTKCRSKRFSVMADLRTHEKHCGREKWSCSCGTTFSRKDKLMGHVSLFFGHRPLAPGSSSSTASSSELAHNQKLWSQVVFPQFQS